MSEIRNSNLIGKITVVIVCCLGAVAIGSPYASNPKPSDGNTIDAILVVLGWHPGDYAVSHDIYFSTNFEDVNNNDPAAFRKNTTSTSELILGLIRGQTYYWRINEVNEAHLDSPWYGDVWSFFVKSYKAFKPNPPDGAEHVSLDPLLEWVAGSGALVHYVYLGTDFNDVQIADTDSPEFRAFVGSPDSNWSPVHDGGLALQANSYYYWRIDESPDGILIYKGDVWSFDTFPPLSGAGTEQDPWLIQSLGDFDEFASDANYWDDYTRLETDVNLAGRVYTDAVIGDFNGVFDGNDHVVKNMTIEGWSGIGLFSKITASVRSLGVENVSISGYMGVGSLAGANYGSISDCYSTGRVDGVEGVGGLMGSNDDGGIVSNCYSEANVSGNDYSSIDNIDIGGLVGTNYGSISNSYATGDVNGIEYLDWCLSIGGLVGWNNGSVSNCYSIGNVNGNEEVGGFVGHNHAGSISNCYSTGSVTGNGQFGGFAGRNEYGSISNCFWDTDTQTHGVTESIGANEGTATNVHGLPTSQMQTRRMFTEAGWDFINVWNIGENQTYPYLRIYLPSDINKDGIVNFLDLSITANQWLQEQ